MAEAELTCQCGKLHRTLAALKQHVRYYCRGAPPTGQDLVCQVCGATYNTFMGVRQHMRHAHPEELNRAREEADRRVVQPWTTMEETEMARAEIAYKGRIINKHLHDLFPHRSSEAIRAHRRSASYLALKDRIASMGEAAPPSLVASPPNTRSRTKSCLQTQVGKPDGGTNVEQEGPSAASRGYRNWSEMERLTLATLEINYSGRLEINRYLHKKHPTRSVGEIQSYRRRADYKTLRSDQNRH